jgi:hypothetical protein
LTDPVIHYSIYPAMKRHPRDDQDSRMENSFVLLARFPELWQADMAVSLLASEGIPAYPADELFVKNTKHSEAIGGVGVVVHEADAATAWDILELAERGELSLQEEAVEYTDESSRQKIEERVTSSRRSELETLNPEPEILNSFSIRCPRCGSENNEKKKGLKALFRPGNHCRVCHWEWKERS